MAIERVGIVGAGQMGNGIAHVFAVAGYDVLLTDVSADALAAALAQIDRNLERQVTRDLISADTKAQAMRRISTTQTLIHLGDSDLIIEAATERETIKAAIFEDLVPHLKPHTILTSNTSSISITRLASRTDRPERFMGFHFMNPVPIMQLVELIRGIATDEPTFRACQQVVERLGKTSTASEDFPGFIVNRILMPMINEAIYTLYEGVGSVQSIDTSLKLGANHPMGPLELADFIGLDTCLAIMNVLHDGLADTKYRPCPLLTKYVEAGWLGRKTQRGFYDYRGGTPVPTRWTAPLQKRFYASGGDIYARKMMVGVASVAFAEFIRDKCRDRRQQRFGIGAACFDLDTGANRRGQHQQPHDAVAAGGFAIAAHGGIGVEALDELDQLGRGTGVQALDIFDFQDRCRHWDMPPLWLLIYLCAAAIAASAASGTERLRDLANLISIGKFAP